MSVKTLIGCFLYNCFAKHLPHTRSNRWYGAKKIRYYCAKMMLAKCGRCVNIEAKANITRELEIGDYSGIGIGSRIYGKVVIGNDVLMGPEVIIFTSSHNYMDPDVKIREQGRTEMSPVQIDDDVWIGARAIIMPGIHIGKGAVIGAGAVVTRDVEQYNVVAGVPAKVIKKRTKENI